MPDSELHEFVVQTLVDGFLQLARVNILTGEYVYLLKIFMSPDTGNGKCETVWIFTEDD